MERYESKESIIRSNKQLVFEFESETNWEFEKGRIECLSMIPTMLSEIEESIKIHRLISEIRESKSKVDERLKELGINLCFKLVFLK